MRKNLSELLNMRGFETIEHIKKFEKYSQEVQKKINSLKGEIAKRDQKIAVLMKEIKALRKLSKMPTEDQMAGEAAKRELAMQEKQGSKKNRYEAPKKIMAVRQIDFQESEEEEGAVERVVEKKN